MCDISVTSASSAVEDTLSEESIWIQKGDERLQVDSKKLEKAEKELQKKQARKAGGAGLNGNMANRWEF